MQKKQAENYTRRADEDALLRKIVRSLRTGKRECRSGIELGMGDDAALWRPRPGYETVLTCDWFLEDVHFLRAKHPPDAIGWKCLARAVSDIAAMGGEPKCFLLGLAIPQRHLDDWLDEFLRGLRRASLRFRCRAAGGDTTRNDKILLNVTVIGEVKRGQVLMRSGASPGDQVFVSGRLGEAELGLRELRMTRSASRKTSACLRKHLYPQPRLELGLWLAAQKLATAMMDLSDGLSTDLARLCTASGAGALIEEEKLPLAQPWPRQTRNAASQLNAALHGGDDYELLFTVPANKARRFPRIMAGTSTTRIGVITSSRDVILARGDGSKEPLRARGWDPFRIR